MFSQNGEVIEYKTHETKEGKTIKCIPDSFTAYDRIEINQGSMTIQALHDWFKNTYNVKVD